MKIEEERRSIIEGGGTPIRLMETMRGEVPVWLPTTSERLVCNSEYCQFKPRGWVEIGGVWQPLVFKVVTEELQSLGLRRNKTILTYPVGEWVIEQNKLIPSDLDWGGIWSARNYSGTKTLTQYMADKYMMRVRTFLAAAANPLYANSYRVKSEGVYLFYEVTGLASISELFSFPVDFAVAADGQETGIPFS